MRVPGIGALYAIPSGANPTPIPFAIISDIQADIKIKLVELHGQWTYSIDAAKTAADFALKAKLKDFRSDVFNMVSPGGVISGGSVLPVTGEAWTIPTTPFQVTVAQGATFSEDGGVLDYTAGKWLSRVASAPTTGQYSVNTGTGVYTFAAADVGHNLSIVYTYSSASVGKTVVVTNTTMGPSTAYAVRVWEVFTINGVTKSVGFKFPAVHFPNLSWVLKAEDWADQSIDGKVVQDPNSQTVFTYYVGD